MIYLSHEESIKEELPSDSQYSINGYGRLVKKEPDCDLLKRNVKHEAKDTWLSATHQPQGMQSYNTDMRQVGSSRPLGAGSNPSIDHPFKGYNYLSSTPRPLNEGIITHRPMIMPQVPNFDLSSLD